MSIPKQSSRLDPRSKKALIAAKRAAEEPAKQRLRAYKRATRRCFWTWPFGHVFVQDGEPSRVRCTNCPKVLEAYNMDTVDPVLKGFKVPPPR